MKRNIASRTLLIVFAAAMVASMAATAQAEDPPCSLARAAGKWGFSDTGTVVGVGPRAAVGILTLDAAGNVVDSKATVSLNGTISEETFSGTYTVNPDCTGSATVDLFDPSGNKIGTITTAMVYVNHMREFHQLFTSVVLANGISLKTVITFDARKLVG